jgi:translation initiation factor IF-3
MSLEKNRPFVGPRVNHRIRAPEVCVVLDGEMLGVLPIRKALEVASDLGLDLVEVDGQAAPPVCKIVDFGRLQYEERKRSRASRTPAGEMKEIRLRPKTSDHDLAIKSRAVRRFLEAGNTVKLTVRFRGREIVHSARSRARLETIAADLGAIAIVTKAATLQSRAMTMILAPARRV